MVSERPNGSVNNQLEKRVKRTVQPIGGLAELKREGLDLSSEASYRGSLPRISGICSQDYEHSH
jgi:hypothetical protein